MIIRRSRRYTINMLNYESYSFGSDVEMSHHDLGVSDVQLKAMNEAQRRDLRSRLTAAVLLELGEQLHDEIADTTAFTENQKSFLLRAFAVPKKRRATNAESPPSRSAGRTRTRTSSGRTSGRA